MNPIPRIRTGSLFVALLIVGGWAYRHLSQGEGKSPAVEAHVAAQPVSLPAAADEAPATGEAARAVMPKAMGNVAGRRADALAKTVAFEQWLTAWRRADVGAQSALAAGGRDLALARRAALKFLIETDPRQALEVAIPEGLRAELPAEVRALLEQRIDARGDFEVQISCGEKVSRTDRFAVIGGERYAAFVFGRRDQQATKFGVPLHGIAIDQVLALDPAPWRELDPLEKSRGGYDAEKMVVLVGGEPVTAASSTEWQALTARLVAAESVPGPHLLREAHSGALPVPGAPTTAAVTRPPSWILGDKRVLWVKVDFADSPGAVATDAEITVTNNAVSEFYRTTSQGKTTMTFTILPSLLRLPKDKAYFNLSNTSDTELQASAKVLAKAYDVANGGTGAFDPDRYDRWIVLFSKIASHSYAGRALLGGTDVRMHGTIAAGTVAHELGHTQSLDHSHYWLPSGTSAVGAGAHVEYGDVFDSMGLSSSSTNNFFNVSQKAKLGYLAGEDIGTITESGTYRIARHDHRDAAGVRALKVARDNVDYEYWFEQRQFGPTSFTSAQLERLRTGVQLHWGPGKAPRFTTGPGSYLVDATPGSSGGANDAALRMGETFVDPDAGVTIKPLAAGGTAPNEYLDVQVSFGAIDGNRNPVLAVIAPPATIKVRTNVVLNASATDPDGDAVYYRWDFGDGKFQPSLNTVTTRYAKGGTYAVSVSAHDGRGGIDAKKFTFDVADPLVEWTQRASGQVLDQLYNVSFAAGKFWAPGTGFVQSSADGITWTRSDAVGPSYAWTGHAHNGARHVLAGLRVSGAERGGIAYSDDGAAWTAAAVPGGIGQIYAVGHAAGRFVAVGELGRIYTSLDGATWTGATSPVTNSLRTVVYASGLFVVSGDAGRILTSPDGVTWENRSVSTANNLLSLARHDGAWYALSSNTQCFTSPDGVTWTLVATAGRTNAMNRAISTGGLLFGVTANGGITFAEDPRSWVTHQLDATAGTTIAGVAEGNGVLVVVGSRGVIYTTSAPTAPVSRPIPAPSLRLEADSLKVSVGKKNILSASGAGFVRLELYANGTKASEIGGAGGAFTWTPAAIGSYSLVVRGITAGGESVVSAAYPAQAAFARWNWRNPSPVGNDLTGAVRVDGKWWIVGRTGAFLTLDADGTFGRVDFPTTQALTGIAYANGRFTVSAAYRDAAAGEDISPILTSTDGYAWTPLLTATGDNFNLNFVTYAADKWLAGGLSGAGGILVTSSDGLVWSRQVTGLLVTIRGAAYGNGTWVAVGSTGKIISSPDAVRWTERTSGVTTDLNGVAYNNGAFVAAGAGGVILRSTDGTTWTRATSGVTTALNGAGVVAGSFVVVGDNGVTLASADGETWTRAAMEGKFSSGLAVTSTGDNAIIVGRAGEIFTASNSASWRRTNVGTGETRRAVIYAGGRFVSVGFRTDPIPNTTAVPVLLSADGVSWTRANGSTALNAANLYAVTHAQNTYVAVGDVGRIFSSANGTDWTSQASGITTTLNAVAGGPAGFVAVGASGRIVSSADGTAWAARTSGVTVTLNSAAYGEGRYVVVGSTGTILTSTDGTTWTAGASGVTDTLIVVRWFENIGFLAGGNSGTMLRSSDGTTWQQVETGILNFIATLTQTAAGILAGTDSSGIMLTSLDGSSWSRATVPADRTLFGLAASPTTVIAVGDNGTTLAFELSDTTPAPAIVQAPAPRLILAGGNAVFSVQAKNAFGSVYQWLKDGQPIAGANLPNYTITGASTANLGRYAVTITSPTGVVTSAPAALTFANANQAGRLVNLSLLTALAAAGDTFTMGAVIGGAGTSGPKPLLVRAVGPSLSVFGLENPLRDPALEFFAGSTLIGSNDNWGGGAALRNAFAAVGAFPYVDATSRDAAIYNATVAPGNNSVKVAGVGGAAGAVLAELYDSTPTDAYTVATPRLINVSVLKELGAGFTAGFVIGGSTPRKILVRAIGPTLGAEPFNIGGVVADPQLALFSGQTQIGANDNWGGAAVLSAAFAQVGAFALAGGSRDAALLAELQPGAYTVQVSGVAATTGLALVEVYEVP